jgi:hypothetical protein
MVNAEKGRVTAILTTPILACYKSVIFLAGFWWDGENPVKEKWQKEPVGSSVMGQSFRSEDVQGVVVRNPQPFLAVFAAPEHAPG